MARVIFFGVITCAADIGRGVCTWPSVTTPPLGSRHDQAAEVHIKVRVLLARGSKRTGKRQSPGFPDEAIPNLLKVARAELLGKRRFLWLEKVSQN